MKQPLIWITGFSGAGKTTIAKAIIAHTKPQGIQPVWLDGDRMRAALDMTDEFDRASRIKLGLTYARLAKELNGQGFCTIVSTISMFDEVFAWNHANLDSYFEVFLDVPESVRKSRDPKGIYREHPESMARQQVTADRPKPDLIIRNDGTETPATVAEEIWRAVQAKFSV
jgi:adenylylsulfate kinase